MIYIQELSKWDDRNGYEISAWSSGTITPSAAVDSWRGSSAHQNVILTQGSWTDLKTVGCAWHNTVAHCWFAKTEPWTKIKNSLQPINKMLKIMI